MEALNITPEMFSDWLTTFLPRIALALIAILIAWILSVFITRALRRALESRKVDPELIVLFSLITRWGIRILGVYLAVEIIAPGQFTAIVAGLGIAGFAVGFATQDVAKNFIAGILLLLQQPFGIGDSIEVIGYSGSVLNIKLRTTEMMTFDGRRVSIPNGDVMVNPIVNFSLATRRRAELMVGVAYESDLDQVSRTAVASLEGLPGMLMDPAPSVVFTNFGPSTVDLTVYFWIDTEQAGLADAQDQAIKQIKLAFEREAIEMPYPTSVVIRENLKST
jgi:small-conductance mechanosensitive channel